ncbi:hypothetical protein F4824DRAFT_502236 [Ustulina deusta]|nr:hypothetical protein F4824DRAFT_502236 [Ustulina deusta]
MDGKKGAFYGGSFVGMGIGALLTYCLIQCPQLECRAPVPDRQHFAQGYPFAQWNSCGPNNHISPGGPRDLKTYLYKTEVWGSNLVLLSGTNPVGIDRDVFNRMTSGTEPLEILTYGCLADCRQGSQPPCNQQPVNQSEKDTESSTKSVMPLDNAYENDTTDATTNATIAATPL